MDKEIKERIAAINSGIIPEGYKKAKVGIVPVEWETVRLKTISKHSTEKNKDLKYRETYTNSATQGIIKQTDYFDKQISNNENIDGYYVVRQNDYVYNPRISVSAPCGPISKSHFSETGVMSPLYTVFRLNDEYEDNGYIEHYFKSSFWYRYMSSVANYGARHDRMNITNEDLFNMPIPSPPLPEQQKIAEILSTQDKLIELQEKKIEQLKELKKAYLQKMFPKKGSKYPELRFKGFTEPWEQRELGSLIEEKRDRTTTENEDTLLSCAIEGMFLNSELFSHFRGSTNIGYLKVKKYDLILSAQNLHLGNCNVNLRFENGIISPAYKTYELISCNPFFIQAWVKQDSTKDFFLRATTEGASACRKNVVWEELYKQTLNVPNIDEQAKIGEYFDTLDTLITLHQRKSEQEKQKKKALMQLLLTGIVRTK
ncbi:MAG TPA: restriction endonuclease subunit S [Ruminococcus sp.]|nr:restriction endonuclease subunit S [Ruminococcus sp.]